MIFILNFIKNCILNCYLNALYRSSTDSDHHDDIRVNVQNVFAKVDSAPDVDTNPRPACQREQFLIMKEKALLKVISEQMKNLTQKVVNATCKFMSMKDVLSSDSKVDSFGTFLSCQELGISFGSVVGALLKIIDINIGQKYAKSRGISVKIHHLIFGVIMCVMLEHFYILLINCIKKRSLNGVPQNGAAPNNIELSAIQAPNPTVAESLGPILKEQMAALFEQWLRQQQAQNESSARPHTTDTSHTQTSNTNTFNSHILVPPKFNIVVPEMVADGASGGDAQAKLTPKNSPLFSRASRRQINPFQV